jgi:hypothetical protein
MELPLKDKVLELLKRGWAVDRIAAQYTIHQHIVQLIADGANPIEQKKTTADAGVKKPKIKKISE